MKENRRHKRFSLDIMEISGKMVFATYVKILDISLGGVSFKADRRLNMGSEYALKMVSRGRELTVKGVIVRSSLTESIKDARGNVVPIYSAGMKFSDTSEKKLKEIEAFIQSNLRDADREIDLCSPSGKRLYIRVIIKDPEKSVVDVQEGCKVRNISLGGMCIESAQALEIDSTVDAEILFPEGRSIHVSVRVVSSILNSDNGVESYNIGTEFMDMPGKDREVLRDFISSLELPAS
ncbi:MAG TPA: PilZ domain-containing protein [Thermodesulfovibrionales bacterium]|nr:PilZ domain-containing protein [Thermodesulfovibrionales bacterium]